MPAPVPTLPPPSPWRLIVQPQSRDSSGNLLLPPVPLEEPQRIEYDPQTGNLTWSQARADLFGPLGALLAVNPQQHRTRSGVYAVTADAGAQLVTVAYRIGSNVTPTLEGIAAGVLMLAPIGAEPSRLTQTLTLLRCDVLYRRDGTVVTL